MGINLTSRFPIGSSILVQIIMGLFLRPATWTVVLQLHQTSRPAVLDVQEAIVWVRFSVRAANGLKLLWANASTSLERECGQTAFHWNHEHVFAAVLAAHQALGSIELVVRSTHETGRFGLAIGLAKRGRGAVGEWNGHDAWAAGLLLQLAQRMVSVAVRSANGSGRVVSVITLLIAFERGRLKLSAGADMGEGDATTGEYQVISYTTVGLEFGLISALTGKLLEPDRIRLYMFSSQCHTGSPRNWAWIADVRNYLCTTKSACIGSCATCIGPSARFESISVEFFGIRWDYKISSLFTLSVLLLTRN